MSAPFTVPIRGGDIRALTNEIWIAISERLLMQYEYHYLTNMEWSIASESLSEPQQNPLALSSGMTLGPVGGGMINRLQDMIVTCAMVPPSAAWRWIDYTIAGNALTGFAGMDVDSRPFVENPYNPGGSGNTYTLMPATWLSEAGLPTLNTLQDYLNGLMFRRLATWTNYPDDPMVFEYGKAQSKDILGNWLIEDMQAALRPLKWVSSGWSRAGSIVSPAKTGNATLPAPGWRTRAREWALYEWTGDPPTLDLSSSGSVLSGEDIAGVEQLYATTGKDFVTAPDFTNA